MARNFHRKRTLSPLAELNITNMIDLGFCLLIVFMIVTPLIEREQTIPINLPVETVREQVPRDDEFQSVSIDGAGNYYFGTRQVSFEDLSRELAGLAARSQPPVLNIRADFTLQYQQVIRLIDEIKRHNLTRISLDTRVEE